MEEIEKSWEPFLYFAYKKAKHFVTRETSFIEPIEIIEFEKNLDQNIRDLNLLLENEEKLKKEIEKMNGYLFFSPKSFGPNKKPRIRPKVNFPFKYQILWAAVILRIGEWFDTNSKMKNIYSMRNQKIRTEFDWMVPWSFNGRIKRIISEKSNDLFKSSYIHYNDRRLYESHQMALQKFHAYEVKAINKLLTHHKTVYKATLDIQEFFPTLSLDKIKECLKKRLKILEQIPEFHETYFDTNKMEAILDILFLLKITYPEIEQIGEPMQEILKDYYETLINAKKQTNKKCVKVEKTVKTSKFNLHKLVDFLNETLPLDLISSNFLSNCVLNEYVDREIQNKQITNKDFYILRYTDDYVILSNNESRISEIIDEIKELLHKINLSYSFEKTYPTRLIDLDWQLKKMEDEINLEHDTEDFKKEYFCKLREWIELDQYEKKTGRSRKLIDISKDKYKNIINKLQVIGIDPQTKKVTKTCFKNNTISKLSSSSDIKLQGLSDQELDMYIKEMMSYMKATGNIGDLKEETIKIFAAWRLNASYQEKSYREVYQWEKVKEFLCILENSIKEYPYKMGFYDVYIILLFQIIEISDTGYEQLKLFLEKIQELLKSETGEGQQTARNIYFPAVRMRILNLLSNQWYRFDEEKRKKLREILEDTFINWYADPSVYWDELYTLYWTLFILRLRLPLNGGISSTNVPPYLLTISSIYNHFFFITEDSKQLVNTEYCNFYITVEMFKKGLYWDNQNKRYHFNELDQLIYKNLQKEKENEENNITTLDWLAFLKIDGDKITKYDWDTLDNLDYETTEDESIYEIYDFLHLSIQRYFENSNKNTSIFEWIKEKRKEQNENKRRENNGRFKAYVKERFKFYGKIRSYFSLSDERLPKLKTEVDSEENIPLADWIFYCQTLPYHLETIPMKQNVLHPLTEYEFVRLLEGMTNMMKDNIEKYTDDNNGESVLMNFEMSPKNWIEFRNESNNGKAEIKFNENKREEISNPSGQKKKNANPLNEELITKCVKLLFSMLTNRPYHTHVKKTFSLYKWNDLQSYFEMTYYPSTAVARLFVNYLNIHQNFYFKNYKMPLEELPYREVYTKDRINNNIEDWIKKYINSQKNYQVYKKANRKVELLEIDIDQLRS